MLSYPELVIDVLTGAAPALQNPLATSGVAADARARRTRPPRAVAFPRGIQHSVDDLALALSVEQLLPGPRDHSGSGDWGHDYGFPGREGSTSVTTMPA
jgi:hypothetical protein